MDEARLSTTDTGLTIKRCMPFLDAMATGWIIPLAATVRLEIREGGRRVEAGWDYELGKWLAKEMGVRLEMVVAPTRRELVPWLLDGKGDVILAGLSTQAARSDRVRFSRPYLETPWVVEPERLRSKSKNTPFDGARLQGRALLTVVAGDLVYNYADNPGP